LGLGPGHPQFLLLWIRPAPIYQNLRSLAVFVVFVIMFRTAGKAGGGNPRSSLRKQIAIETCGAN
jgi:hypothetical protein